MERAEGQQHPLGIYLRIWLLLFVLSTCSYLVDYFHLQGYLRWTLVVAFMLMKAGLIVAIFMHMRWERLALITTMLVPPLCLLILVGIMTAEADHTLRARERFFDTGTSAASQEQRIDWQRFWPGARDAPARGHE